MQTIFSGHTQGRLAELIAPKKYLHGFETSASSVLELIVQKRCLHGFGTAAILLLLLFFAQNACVSDVSAASMTLTVPAAISLDVQPTGTLAKSSASSFSAKTDGAWGYNLSIKAKSSANMVNGSASLSAISKNMTESEYQAAGNNNTWGFMPSKLNNNSNSNFIPASTSGTTIEKTSAANASTANNYSITLGAKVDNTILGGTYKSTLVLTLSANSVNYSITYNLNSGSWSGTSPQTGSTTADSITLDSHAPTKSNYTFTGWCSSSNITNNNTTTDPTCTGTKYSAGGTYKLSSGGNSLTLYAMWKQNGTSYNIAYNCVSGSSCPSTQSGVSTSGSVALSSTTPSKSGYTFQGWCSTSPSSNNSASVTCSGYTYQPSGSYPLSRGANVTLYAMWGPVCPSTVTSCSKSGYYGKRFGSGKCWMSSDFKTSVTWSSNFGCPSGWSTPTQTDFNNLTSVSQAGSGACLYEQGWSGLYWSSTAPPYSSGAYYYLGVDSTYASISLTDSSYNFKVRCVSP